MGRPASSQRSSRERPGLGGALGDGGAGDVAQEVEREVPVEEDAVGDLAGGAEHAGAAGADHDGQVRAGRRLKHAVAAHLVELALVVDGGALVGAPEQAKQLHVLAHTGGGAGGVDAVEVAVPGAGHAAQAEDEAALAEEVDVAAGADHVDGRAGPGGDVADELHALRDDGHGGEVGEAVADELGDRGRVEAGVLGLLGEGESVVVREVGEVDVERGQLGHAVSRLVRRERLGR